MELKQIKFRYYKTIINRRQVKILVEDGPRQDEGLLRSAGTSNNQLSREGKGAHIYYKQ